MRPFCSIPLIGLYLATWCDRKKNITPPQTCPCSRTYECFLTWQKGLCKCDLMKDLRCRVLDYPGGFNVIRRVLTKGRQQNWSQRRYSSKSWSDMGTGAKGSGKFLKARKFGVFCFYHILNPSSWK